MSRLPPLNALKAFEAAARHLNFRVAADEIGVTQGAVAQQVRNLEGRLGVQLFERQARGLSLTDAGRRYRQPVQRAFEMIAEATEELSPEGSITISTTSSFASKWLVPRLGGFAEQNPDIHITVDASDRLANFQSDGVDIAVRQAAPPFSAGLRAELLSPLDLVPVCSPAVLDGAHPLRQPADLIHHVLLQDAHGFWPLFLQQIFGQASKPKIRTMDFSLTALAIDAAVNGQGVALASRLFVVEERASGRLVCPFDMRLENDLGFYTLAPRKPRQPERVTRVRQWLKQQVEACGPALVSNETTLTS